MERATLYGSHALFLLFDISEKSQKKNADMDRTTNEFFIPKQLKVNSICQYLPLAKLITQLTLGKYAIRRKSCFEDVNEKKRNIKLAFLPIEAGVIPDDDTRMRILYQLNSMKEYETLSQYFASCWSMNTGESFHMWKCYGGDYGVCIVSSVNNVIASFHHEEFSRYKTYCAPISYRNQDFTDTPEDSCFIKGPEYKSENELRFFFVPKVKDDMGGELIWIPYDYKVMIDKVILSPFISRNMFGAFSAFLKSAFGLEVVRSVIEI